jgi:hypothetical protein
VTLALDADLGSWDPAGRTLLFLLGLILLGAAGMSIVRTMVVPRMTVSWIFAVVIRTNDALFNGIARLMRGYPARDRVLAWSGPVSIISALIVWLVFFICAYSLMIFGVTDVSLGQALLQAGSGLLTLGLVGTPGESVTVLDFLAAMTGPAVIALLIGFLPTLYQAYLARESRVLLNAGLSGAPAWGPEYLVRIKMLKGDTELPESFVQWLPWIVQVRLTQTLYPSLNRFRSPVSTRNWLTGLLSTLDAAALHSAITQDPPDPRTVTLLQQGGQAIVTIDAAELSIDGSVTFQSWERRAKTTLSVFGFTRRKSTEAPHLNAADTYLPSSMEAVAEAVTLDSLRGRFTPSRELLVSYEARESDLSREDFDQALDYIASAGIAIERDRDEAFEIFRRIRGRYETAAYHLAQRFYLPRAPWSGPRSPQTPVMWPTLAGKLQES